MQEILINVHGFTNDRLFDSPARDNCHEPFAHLRERLHQLGYALKTADDHPVEYAARVIQFDVPTTQATPWWRPWKRRSVERNLVAECQAQGLADRLALVVWEPPVVQPENWNRRRHEPFPVILTWNDEWVDGVRYRKLREAVPYTFPAVADVPFGERGLAVMIAGNKRSGEPGELYSARRKSIRVFEHGVPGKFELYGPGWRRALHPSYRGTVTHKWTVYPRFRFGLCYENMGGVPGLISEKIFDCMRAGCVPVYWGAPNIAGSVDPACFVDRTRFNDDADLLRYLRNVPECDYRRHLEAIRDYLSGIGFAAFLPEAFAQTFIDALHLQDTP